MVSNSFFLIKKQSLHTPKNMFPIACYQATGQYFAHLASNDRFPAILNAQNPAIPSAHPHKEIDEDKDYVSEFVDNCGLLDYFEVPDNASNFGVLCILNAKCVDILEDLISDFYLPMTLYKRRDIDIMLELHRRHYEEVRANQ